MSDKVTLEGVQYISSKRASVLSGYAQDYIGQLARAGLIDAKRIGGLWYVSLDSLNAYKTNADAYKPEPPKHGQSGSDLDAVISFDGKQFVSAARAAKTTGYHQDYVGQLARSGKILSRQVGNRWYVDHEALAAHKSEKDALLGAVQVESVGIVSSQRPRKEALPDDNSFFTYTQESGDLIPVVETRNAALASPVSTAEHAEDEREAHYIPIRRIDPRVTASQTRYLPAESTSRRATLPLSQVFVSAALTIVIVLSIGFASLKGNSLYAANIGSKISQLASAGSVAQALGGISEWIETIVASEMTYTRSK